ncbi:retrovirus polyprotein [Penicillium manginii]|uniref:retrovirus polyprotein n=1 Tax=Penicillium manginii TaxID=203109 RepID=UPI002547FA6F|nr:retrovirus polyprotein [Penicillium manginii]KAJ5740104.1 retrovirus polyprotein [Penicillium manginii]
MNDHSEFQPLETPEHKDSGIYIETFDNLVPVKCYDGCPGTPITHFVRFTLHIDGRRQLQVPMMITDLGQ